MPQWIGSAATVATALVALAALIVSIWLGLRAARKRDFEILLERIDREAAKREERIDREAAKREERIDREAAKREEQIEREAAKREERIRELMDRSDRKFESLQRRTDELYRQSAEVTARVAHNEAVPGTAMEPTPARGETEAVAAQDVAVGRPRE